VRDLTYIAAFFENRGQLQEQQRFWRGYVDDLRAHFHAIVTDDASPKGKDARPVWEAVDIASYRLYRAEKNRRWDWLYCRNLGVAKASTEWVLLTDIDHVLPEDSLRYILTADLDATAVYRTTRVDAVHPLIVSAGDEHCEMCAAAVRKYVKAGAPHGPMPPYVAGHVLTPYKQHPNTWLMTRTMFDRIGGYDERFSGFYGSDSEFRERVQKTASAVITLPAPLIRYPREVIPDASTVSYERKEKGVDDIHVPRIKAERDKIPNWKPLRLTIGHTLEASQ
jgi:hypothetical protein